MLKKFKNKVRWHFIFVLKCFQHGKDTLLEDR